MAPSCGILQIAVFVLALVFGTCCSLSSKFLLSMRSIGLTGEEEAFSFPLFQTFGMFLGMTFALALHWSVIFFNIPFPGYKYKNKHGQYIQINGDGEADEPSSEPPKPIPLWMYFVLIIPALFDLCATALCMFGLRHVNVSIYQMLRGGAIVFVAVLKQFFLADKDKLKRYQWVGVFWNFISILLVGYTAMSTTDDSSSDNSINSSSSSSGDSSSANVLMGIILILSGAFVQSLQYVFEERMMNMGGEADGKDVNSGEEKPSIPPLLLIGMEGLWGLLVCVCVLYPLAYMLPGSDHGCIENPFNTYAMIQNSKEIQFVFILYFFSIFFFNILCILLTFLLSALWHCILDNFRPITVWGLDLFIYYNIVSNDNLG